jgi:hypothetical protein
MNKKKITKKKQIIIPPDLFVGLVAVTMAGPTILEHIFTRIVSTEIVMSSVCLAPRELNLVIEFLNLTRNLFQEKFAFLSII